MDSIPGEQWLSDYARWVKSNEAELGGSLALKGTAPPASSSSLGAASSWINPVNWISPTMASSASPSPSKPPMSLRLNPHHLYYLLIRAEAAGILVGPLDVKAPSASRPTSYFAFVANETAGAHKVWSKQRDDTMSVRSGISMGALSNFTIGSTRSWWAGTKEQASNPTKDIKYVYSALTKVPSLELGPPPPRLIQDFEDCPGELSVPIDCFKNVQSLVIEDVDPRTLLGWDRASMQLRSLTLKRSGLEDVSELMVDCVVNDARRRRGEKVRRRERRVHKPVPEEAEETGAKDQRASPSRSHRASEDSSSSSSPFVGGTTDSPPPPHLPVLSWHFLKHLSLADNSLTFLPSTPLYALVSLVSLDLSNNLLNAVPPSLAHVGTLLSLDASGNLIDSVLGIPETLPNVRALNLARNRLESLCGLERLRKLQRVDLRSNGVFNAGEVGRLAAVESAREIWIKGNPLMEELEDPRVDVFVEFAKEGRDLGLVKLDGEGIGYFERQRVASRVPRAQGGGNRGATPAASEGGGSEVDALSASVGNVAREAAPVKAVRHRAGHHAGRAPSAAPGRQGSTAGAPSIIRANSKDRAGDGGDEVIAAAAAARRRNRRLVDLDAAESVSNKAKTDDGRQELMSDSDAIKRAALEGRTEEALGVASAAAKPAAPAEGEGDGRPEARREATNETSAGIAAAPARGRGRTSGERPMSIVAPGSMSLSRKAGAAAALLTSQAGNGGGAGGGKIDPSAGPEMASPASLASPKPLPDVHQGASSKASGGATQSSPRPASMQRRNTSGSVGGGGGSSTLGRRGGREVLLRYSTTDGSSFPSHPPPSSSSPTSPGVKQIDSLSLRSGTSGPGVGGGESSSVYSGGGEGGVVREQASGGEAGGGEDESSPKSRIRVGRRGNAASIAARRSKWTTSMYAPGTSYAAEEGEATTFSTRDAAAASGSNTTSSATATAAEAKSAPPQRFDDFRRRIEALRGDVGDDWLRVLARGESVYVPREEDELEEEEEQRADK